MRKGLPKRRVARTAQGAGKRFAALTKSISLGKRVRNPKAVATQIGKKKYQGAFQKMAVRGRKRKTRRFL